MGSRALQPLPEKRAYVRALSRLCGECSNVINNAKVAFSERLKCTGLAGGVRGVLALERFGPQLQTNEMREVKDERRRSEESHG